MTGTLKRRLIGHLSVLKPKSGPGNAFQDRFFAPEVPFCSVRQTIVAALALTISACAAHAARRAKRHRRREGSRRHGERLEVVGVYVNVCATALEAFPLGHLPNRQNGSVDCAALPIKALDGPHDIFVVDLEPAARFVQRFVVQLFARRLNVGVLLVGRGSLLPSCSSMIRNEYKPPDAMAANRAPKASI